MNTWGITNTYGVFQTYYELEVLRDSTPSAISWIGSIQAFLLMLVGALTGPVYDAGYFRELLWGGSFFLVTVQNVLKMVEKAQLKWSILGCLNKNPSDSESFKTQRWFSVRVLFYRFSFIDK